MEILPWYCEKKADDGFSLCGNTFEGTLQQFKSVYSLCPKCYQALHPEHDLSLLYDYKTLQKYGLEVSLPITQKALGLKELVSSRDGRRICDYGLFIPDFIIIKNKEDIVSKVVCNFISDNYYRLFARPCPKTPRHGFVDSRPVQGIPEIEAIFDEMRLADPESELILMKRIEASHNAVITNTTAAIGIGNDGATAGKKAITLPVHGELRKYKDSSSITESAFLETVYDSNTAYAVQLRNGPELPRTKDIIPESLTVDEIIDVDKFEPHEDLLAWEALCNEIKADRDNGKRKGLVIVHVNGPIGSHFCVHAVIRKIPFVTSHMPTIGEKLEKTAPNPVDFREVKKGIELGLSKEFYAKVMVPLFHAHGSDSHSRAFKGLMYSSLYALHASPVCGKEESKLIGLGIANLIRVSVCAALGESRHHRGIIAMQGKTNRDSVYKKYFEDVFAGIKKLQVTEQIFLDGTWGESFGGKNWASCTRATITLVNKTIAFVRRPDERNFIKVMSQFNLLINEVHNGGKFLNKFVSNVEFDHAAKDLALFVASRANELYRFITSAMPILEQGADFNSFSGMKLLRQLSKKDKVVLKTITDAVDDNSLCRHDVDVDIEHCCRCTGCRIH